MTFPGGEAATNADGGRQRTGPRPCPPSATAASPNDLLRILRACSADKPITQLDAGVALGFTGGKETIRRHVQHLREDLTRQGHVICADGRGMWIAETEKEIDRYYARLLAMSHSTLRTAALVKRVSLRRLIRDLYESLREQGEVVPATPPQPEKRVRRVESGPGADSPKCAYCDERFESPRGREHMTLYCSAACRYRAANERRAAS